MRFKIAPAAVSNAAHYSHRIIWSTAELEGERSTWESMVDQYYDANPFVGLDWHLHLLNHFALPGSVYYLRISFQDEVVAYFPFLVRRVPFHRIPVLALTFPSHFSPFTCPLLKPDIAEETVRYVMTEVLSALNWDIFLRQRHGRELSRPRAITARGQSHRLLRLF